MGSKKAWSGIGHAFFFGLLFLSLWLSPWLFASCVLSPAELKKIPRVEASKIIDGDSLTLSDGQKIRLIGVNTPEIRGAEPLAQEAKKYLGSVVSSKKLYLRRGEQQQDRYGRTLGHLYLDDGRNVETEILRKGLGFLVAMPPNVAMVSCHKAARDQARAKKIGVWAQPAFAVVDSKRIKASETGFIQVSGKLLSVDSHRKTWWLQLDGLVVLRIAPKDQPYFSLDALKAMQGKKVTASGWMVDRSGKSTAKTAKKKYSPFMLLLTHPVHIELS